MARVFRAVSFVIGGLGIIGSFLVANQPKVSSALTGKLETEFNFFIFLTALIGTILCALVFYGIGEILTNQGTLLSAQNKILNKLEGLEREREKPQTPNTAAKTNAAAPVVSPLKTQEKPGNASGGYFSRSSGLPWTCRNCGTSNSPNRDICENCGKKR